MHWTLRKCLKNAFQIVSPCTGPHSQLPLSYCGDSNIFAVREVQLLRL